MRLLCASIAVAACCFGQEFEVVSIKPNNSMSGGSHSRSDQGMLTGVNLSLRSLILRAYGIKDYQLEGPDWLASEHFDMAARFPESISSQALGREKYAAALGSMMQKMLAERFALAVHRDQKTVGVYGLLVGKSGIRFKQVPDGGPSNSDSRNSHYTGTGVSLDNFAAFLSAHMDMPVLNFTGLKGVYNLTLDWVPESRQAKDDASSFPAGPSLFDAVQDQLGLRLERRKAPVEIIVVDHAEKTPVAN
jgi:uncharacterized protein (TIGR03435 family)